MNAAAPLVKCSGARHFEDWISSYMQYAGFGEAPRHMAFWTAVSTIAGVLQRRVWIEQVHFQWYPNFYIVLVAPPGIVAKSSTISIGMNLLKQVPGVMFGPDVVTWQALVEVFMESTSNFTYQDATRIQSPVTLESSEFGNLLDPRDRRMVDLLTNLWDGKQGEMRKRTKFSGNETIENPWINLIACTTPAWIADNFPAYMIGGGFTSRVIFVYAEEKGKLVPYLEDVIPSDFELTKQRLVEDLVDMSKITGCYQLTSEAKEWGREWYTQHFSQKPLSMEDTRYGGYIARKQTHIHKLAMVLAASQSNTLTITKENLETANIMITDLEPDMARVFAKVGKSEFSFYADRLVQFIHSNGPTSYTDAYRYVHTQFPNVKDFENIFAGLVKGKFIKLYKVAGVAMVEAIV